MICGQCRFDNPEGMRFCGKCGSSLAMSCANCGFESPPGFAFCGKCGKSLEAASTAPEPSTPPHSPPPTSISGGASAERRQVTVLFCDLVGSTQLSERLDAEELREIVQAYQTAAGEVIERYEGHVAQYLGDGLLVYFGYPKAQEDAARRAVLSGLQIVEAMARLNVELQRSRNLTVSVRIGIHTGSGVVGDVGGRTKREQLVIGTTPNVAARLQGLAAPDQVVISAVTQRLVHRYFDSDSLGPQSLKGVSLPLEALVVTREKRTDDALGTSTVAPTPLVGRKTELAVLRDKFQRAREGRGQGVLVAGEAGIGKSRLLHAFRAELGEATPWVTCRCSPYVQNTSFLPLVEPFARLLGVDTEAPAADKLARLDAWAATATALGPDAEAILATFLSIPLPDDRAHPPLTPQQERDGTLRLLTRILVDRAASGPLVFVVEDLHWADPSTLAFVQTLLGAATSAKLLVLLATRPQFSAPWPLESHVVRVDLAKLGDASAEQIVLRLAGGRPIPAEVLRQIVDKCDGVPLFIEELTKAVLESGLLIDRGDHFEMAQPTLPPTIPVTLQDSLTARLDRMGAAKELLQLAAALGRRFIYELLAAVAAIDEHTLRERLGKLVAGELIYREPTPRHEAFKFKHALIQDTAYSSMLKATRKSIHERIALVLEERFPETAEIQPELLARHFEEAMTLDRAVDYLTKAGQRAMQRSALLEGLRHYGHALELLAQLPPSLERDKRELAALVGMGGALIATRGYAALDIEKNYARALSLCERLGDPPELFPVLYGLWVFNLARSHRAPTLEYAGKLLALVARTRIANEELSAHFAHGTTLLYRGDLGPALAAFDRAVSRYKPAEHWSLVRFYGDDHGLFSQVYAHWVLLLSGKPDTALEKGRALVAHAERLNDPLALAMVLVMTMLLHRDVRDPEGTLELAERAIAVSRENGLPFWLSTARIGRGWARLVLYGDAAALPEIREGLAFFDLIEQKLPLTYWSGYLVESLLRTDQIDEGLALIDRCIEWADTNVDSFYAPELCRLKADLLAKKGASDAELEACFRRAIAYAEGSGADFLELRCAAGYARWLAARGRAIEGRVLLAKARGKLVEGAKLQDVVEADALLAELPSA